MLGQRLVIITMQKPLIPKAYSNLQFLILIYPFIMLSS